MHRTIKTSLTLILVLSASVASAQAPPAEGLVPITDPRLLESWGFAPGASNVHATPQALAQLAMDPAEAEEVRRSALETQVAVDADVRSPFGGVVGHTAIDQAAFHPLRSTTVHEADGDGGRFCTNGFPWFQGVFAGLPHGARLTTFQFWTFDSSTESITGVVVRTCNQDFATPQLTVLGSYVSVGSAGYDTAIVNANPSFVDIDGRCTYSVQYRLDGQESAVCSEGDALRLVGARARWVRQVSPAPDTATFDDVPTTHLFFQHIEALVASGVTAGCDADSYCPDAPLDRGQMAVFLAKALGL